MDAVKFLKEYKRMCGEVACEGCQLYSDGGCNLLIAVTKSLDLTECVEAVEQWAKDHPVKTRQSEFLKMFPNAPLLNSGVVGIDPCVVDVTLECKCGGCCSKCCCDYWLQEVE